MELQHIKEVKILGNLTIIRLARNVTFESLSGVQNEFASVTKDKTIHNVLFDLQDVAEADSSGIAVLIDLIRRMKVDHIKGEVALLHLSKHMRSLIEVLKVGKLFKEYDLEAEAVKELK